MKDFALKHNQRPVYYKSLEVKDFKVDKESRTVSGYLAAFGNIDSDRDILMKGCFAKSLQERGPSSTTARKIAFCWMHDLTDPIGHFTKLEETDAGLYFEAYVDDVPNGNRALTQYASGTLNQHSIGYRYVWDKCKFEQRPDPEHPGETIEVFVCYEINLFEGSVVTLGANENTPYAGLKGQQIEDASKALATDTENLLKDLEPGIAYSIRKLISRHIALAESDEPTKSLGTESEPQGINWESITKAIQTNTENQ